MLDINDVYEEYARTVFKFLYCLCHDADLAEELTQETFYRAIKSSNRYDGTCKVSTWLCQIGKHLWYQELARKKRREVTTLDENIPSDPFNFEERLYLTAEKMELIKAVHLLDDTAKEVVLLRITGAFSFREIGDVFLKNENWARVTFYRAKQKIMKGITE